MERFGVELAPCQSEKIRVFGDTRISVISDRIIRVEKVKSKKFIDNKTQIVNCRNYSNIDFNITNCDNKVTIETKYCKFIIFTDTLEYHVFIGEKEVKVDNAKNLKGTIRTLDGNAGFVRFPNGIMSRSGLTVLEDNTIILNEDGSISLKEKGYIDFYLLAFGNDYLLCLNDFYCLTGHPPIIPKYALGNWWSRYHDYSDAEYLELMDKFKGKCVPITVATVDMDWHYVKDVPKNFKTKSMYGRGWTGYTFNEKLFPDYKGFLNSLHERNLAVTLNLHPRDGVRYFEKQYEDMAKINGIEPNSKKPVKFNLVDKTFRDSYFDILHHPYEEDGVDFWWIDWQQGKRSKMKGVDPLWLLNHYHFMDINRKTNGIILSRFSGIGSHRYPLGFSGDTIVCWNSLKLQPYFTSTAANVGYTWWSHDIGGHMYSKGDPELYLRWLQFGVFSPINRLHSTKVGISKEPWLYPSVEDIAEDYMRLRHKLIPYLYSASYENTTKGTPICAPMYYFFNDEKAYKKEYRNQYIFGGHMLVCPIVSPKEGDKSKLKIWFPEGKWINIFTGETYEGNKEVELFFSLSEYPVFVRPGTIIPLMETEDNKISYKKLTLDVYLGNGKYELFDDALMTMEINQTKSGYTMEFGGEKIQEIETIDINIKNIENASFLVDGISAGSGPKVTIKNGAKQVIIKNIIQG